MTSCSVLAGHQADLLADAEGTVDHPDVNDDTLVVVELRVENQGPERGVRVAGRRGTPFDDRAEHFGDPLTGLAADGQHLGPVDAQCVLDLFLDLIGPRRLHVDLVQDGHDHQVGLDRRVGVGDGLRLYALGGVDEEDRPFAGGEAARDLVVEVDVPGGVDQFSS